MASDIDEQVRKLMLKIGYALAKEMKENIVNNGAVDTGALLNSIHVEMEGDAVIVGSNLEYAPHVEFGTRPHFPPLEPIEEWARRKLKGDKATARKIAWKIYHYGTPPQPFLRPAIDKLPEIIKRIME